jgi:hypothetical protein
MKRDYNEKRIKEGKKKGNKGGKVKSKKRRLKRDMKKCAETLNKIMEESDIKEKK